MSSSPCGHIIVAILSLALASCTRVSGRFEDVSAAEREGFFDRGWLPDVLPIGAGPIVEVHDLDTNARCSRSGLPPCPIPELKLVFAS